MASTCTGPPATASTSPSPAGSASHTSLGLSRDQVLRRLAQAAKLVQLQVLVLQIFLGADLLSNPGARGPLGPLTSLMIVFFAFGVTRTWEYVDGLPMGRWGTISEATHSLVRETDASPAAPAEPPEEPDRQIGEH